MAKNSRIGADQHLDAVLKALEGYKLRHPRAVIDGYRQNSASIRIRIVDPEFADVSRADRHDDVWHFFEELPEEIQSQISVLLLLTPNEKKKSFASIEFDDPIPPKL